MAAQLQPLQPLPAAHQQPLYLQPPGLQPISEGLTVPAAPPAPIYSAALAVPTAPAGITTAAAPQPTVCHLSSSPGFFLYKTEKLSSRFL